MSNRTPHYRPGGWAGARPTRCVASSGWRPELPTVADADLLDRYHWFETRSAAAVFAAANPTQWADLLAVLRDFHLSGALAAARRQQEPCRGRTRRVVPPPRLAERHYRLEVAATVTTYPYQGAGESEPTQHREQVESSTHRLDNVAGRAAVEVEWNPKDGNLDRDIAALRAMFDAGFIDVAAIIMRHHSETSMLANTLAASVEGYPKDRRLLNTTTTANFEKASDRLRRGDAGGVPMLLVGIGTDAYQPGLPFEFHREGRTFRGTARRSCSAESHERAGRAVSDPAGTMVAPIAKERRDARRGRPVFPAHGCTRAAGSACPAASARRLRHCPGRPRGGSRTAPARSRPSIDGSIATRRWISTPSVPCRSRRPRPTPHICISGYPTPCCRKAYR